MAGERPGAARPGGPGLQQGAELTFLDERNTLREAGVRSPLEPYVDGLSRRGGGHGREPVATREGQCQWFLGVQMLACSHCLAANRFVQVAWNRRQDRI